MKLQELRIKNIKGVRDFTLIPGCQSITVLGDNATGKSTIADSLTWLPFGKDSSGAKDFGIKTIDPETGQAIPNLEHSVEAIFVHDGDPVKLKKVYYEVYTKARGEATASFTGHTTDHYINDVPVKQKDYQAKVAEIGQTEDLFRLLTNPTIFPKMHWADQRKLLLEVCGGVSDADVIASNPDLVDLPGILGSHSVEDYQKIAMATRKKINEALKQIPARIDEAERSKPADMAVTNPQVIIDKLNKLHDQTLELNQRAADIKAGGGAAPLREEIAGYTQDLKDLESRHEHGLKAATAAKEQALTQEGQKRWGLDQAMLQAKAEIASVERQVAQLTTANAELLANWHEINKAGFGGADLCPTCGQDLPEEKVNEARATFEKDKAARKEAINQRGVTNKKAIAELQENLASLHGQKDEEARERLDLDIRLAAMQAEIAGIIAQAPLAIELPEYQAILTQKAAAEKRLSALATDQTAALTEMETKRAEVAQVIEGENKKLAQIEALQKAKDRIVELADQEKQLAAEFEKFERHLWLCDLFTRTKVSSLDDQINSKFKVARFKLFNVQVNGGLEPTCVVTVDGVPYPDLNSAAKIQVGLDIIQTLGDYYGFKPFVLVDGRESVTWLPEMDAQVISLQVSADHPSLYVCLSAEK